MNINTKRRLGLAPVKKKVVFFLVTLIGFTTLSVEGKDSTSLRITDKIKVVGYQDEVDYFSQMKECAKDGGKYAMLIGEIYEKQRNLKIDHLGLPYEKTEFFENYSTGDDVLKAMNGDTAPVKKVKHLKSEHNVAGQVYEYLNAQGMSDIAIAGILGNMMAECGGQTLDLKWDAYGGGGSYYGLCQWSLYYNPSVDGTNITEQLDYLMSNIRTNMDYFGGNYDEFCTITESDAAAKYFCNYYERGSGLSARATNAKIALAWLQADCFLSI